MTVTLGITGSGFDDDFRAENDYGTNSPTLNKKFAVDGIQSVVNRASAAHLLNIVVVDATRLQELELAEQERDALKLERDQEGQSVIRKAEGLKALGERTKAWHKDFEPPTVSVNGEPVEYYKPADPTDSDWAMEQNEVDHMDGKPDVAGVQVDDATEPVAKVTGRAVKDVPQA